MENKIDRIQSDISEIKTHLAVYNEQLKIHIKGVEILDKRLAPVEKHVNMVNGALKLIAIVAMISAIIELLMKFR